MIFITLKIDFNILAILNNESTFLTHIIKSNQIVILRLKIFYIVQLVINKMI